MTDSRSEQSHKNTLWIIAVALAFLTLAGFRREDDRSHDRLNVAYASVASLKNSLIHPGDLEFDAVNITDNGTACIAYRARDRYGGVSQAQAVVHGRRVARSELRDGRFQTEWNRECSGLAFDATHAVNMFF